jgi:dinuclear metal center YbgI/SA1388 family protein
MRLRELVEILEERYDPSWAEPWDAVGLVCGDPEDEVTSVLFAVDPVEAVVEEAIASGVGALVVHHPLLLTPVSSVAATTPKGRVLHRLVRAGVALYTAHTSADVPARGVNEAIAATLGLVDVTVLSPTDDASPESSVRGHGRVGTLPEPSTLRDFAAYVDQRFLQTAHGVRVAGDPARDVRRVAVAAGSGESLLEDARRAGADVVVTSDLKHHRASEFLEEGGPALVDLAHWAAEWTWLPVVQAEVDRAVAERGLRVETRVSTIVTDPWTFRV